MHVVAVRVQSKTTPHPPQFLSSVSMLLSQPLLASPSQSWKLVLHMPYTQVPVAQTPAAVVFIGAQRIPQLPQLALVLVGVSQPLWVSRSQSWKLGLHVPYAQVPVAQSPVPVEFAGAQAVAQPPQSMSVLVAVSQPLLAFPSQFLKLPVHAPNAQVPLEQSPEPVECTGAQAIEQPPQLVRVVVGVSQPSLTFSSQSAKWALHAP